MNFGGFGGLVEMGLDILNIVRDATTNALKVQLGDVVREIVDSEAAEWIQQVGFASMPGKPTKGKRAAQALVLRFGGRDFVIGSRDLRIAGLYGQLDYGETALFAGGPDGTGQARVFLKKDGTVALYTAEGNVEGGPSTVIQVTGDGRAIMATAHGAITIDSDNSVKIAAKSGGGAQLDANGVSLLGQSVAVNGGSVGLGALPTFSVARAEQLAVALGGLNVALAAAFAAPPATLITGGPAVVAACAVLTTALLPGLPTSIASPSVKTT